MIKDSLLIRKEKFKRFYINIKRGKDAILLEKYLTIPIRVVYELSDYPFSITDEDSLRYKVPVSTHARTIDYLRLHMIPAISIVYENKDILYRIVEGLFGDFAEEFISESERLKEMLYKGTYNLIEDFVLSATKDVIEKHFKEEPSYINFESAELTLNIDGKRVFGSASSLFYQNGTKLLITSTYESVDNTLNLENEVLLRNEKSLYSILNFKIVFDKNNEIEDIKIEKYEDEYFGEGAISDLVSINIDIHKEILGRMYGIYDTIKEANIPIDKIRDLVYLVLAFP